MRRIVSPVRTARSARMRRTDRRTFHRWATEAVFHRGDGRLEAVELCARCGLLMSGRASARAMPPCGGELEPPPRRVSPALFIGSPRPRDMSRAFWLWKGA